MLHAGLDLRRKRLDVRLLEEGGATKEVKSVRQDADALRTASPGAEALVIRPSLLPGHSPPAVGVKLR